MKDQPIRVMNYTGTRRVRIGRIDHADKLGCIAAVGQPTALQSSHAAIVRTECYRAGS